MWVRKENSWINWIVFHKADSFRFAERVFFVNTSLFVLGWYGRDKNTFCVCFTWSLFQAVKALSVSSWKLYSGWLDDPLRTSGRMKCLLRTFAKARVSLHMRKVFLVITHGSTACDFLQLLIHFSFCGGFNARQTLRVFSLYFFPFCFSC